MKMFKKSWANYFRESQGGAYIEEPPLIHA